MGKSLKIELLLDKLLLNRDIRVDRFDGDYLDDFHHIMKENYNINSLTSNKNENFIKLLKLFPPRDKDIKNYGKSIKQFLTIDINKYKSIESTDLFKNQNKYSKVKIWDKTQNLKLNSTDNSKNENIININELQKQYSSQHGGLKSQFINKSNFWDRDKNTAKKEKLFKKLCTPDTKVLCIGPRWVNEINFINENFGCQALGLDLLVKKQEPDMSLIIEGDMHNMPLEDNQFNIIYQKNTFNKSYNIRKCLDECIRVLKSGGVIISDDVLGYKNGVNEIARTNINRNSWYTAYLKEYIDEVLINKELKGDYGWFTYSGLYAVKIKK